MSGRTVSRLAGSSALAALLAVSVSATAHATGPHSGGHGGKGWDSDRAQPYGPEQEVPGGTRSASKCEFSVNGERWTAASGLRSIKPADDGTISLDVRGDGGACTVSLASFLAHGPTFATSGKQVLVDHSTVSLDAEATGTLTVKVPDATCFAQIDLYKGSTRYDGGEGPGHGPVPEGPDKPVIGDKLIAAWNGPAQGGENCIGKPEQPQPTPSPSEPEVPEVPEEPELPEEPEESQTPEPEPSEGTGTPTDPASPAPTQPEEEPTTEPSAPASSPAPQVGGEDDDTSLATTGSDSNVGVIAGAAAALVAAGAGVLLFLRRRATTRSAA
ncbi:LAETG motif-containing sortase-dependent surface protein [Streptomyces sp. TRM 70351]|uniref:LAETG motif-containing sortase-dependent surface protein n=1 Tax=Streptomyces sp. TRM 70351 TaxID=3116552 RepID=UPI002E7ABDE0|nr:LAETG motif-containing sortase-dependent surface protein [Streptomyces sp. TRM 70351]MEE1929964.1 LAETG motif-containing sortase-dependent surface protein [Streptomyces sp. TRM 70351]